MRTGEGDHGASLGRPPDRPDPHRCDPARGAAPLRSQERTVTGPPGQGSADLGYGFGIFLIAAGLILALAISDRIEGIDLGLIGWILAGAGALVVVITAIQANARRSATTTATTATTTHPDGSQVTEQRTTERQDPPPVA